MTFRINYRTSLHVTTILPLQRLDEETIDDLNFADYLGVRLVDDL